MIRRFSPRRGAVVLALAALAACDSPVESPEQQPEDLAAMVEALGFRGDMVQDFGDYVVVEGDIRIPKAQLLAAQPRPAGDAMGPRFHYRTFNLVGSPKVHQVRVDLSGLNGNPDWQNAAREAIAHWNALPHSYVHMEEGASPDIVVVANCGLGSGTAGRATWPSGGNPGPTIEANPCFSSNHAQRVRNMVHEFGHTLGLRHTNWQSRGESAGSEGAVHIVATPTGKDNASVMNGGTAGESWAGFSYNDIWAVWGLYPIPDPAVTVTYTASGDPIVSWTPVFGALSYTVRRTVWISGHDEFGSFNAIGERGAFTNASSPYVDTGWPYTGVSVCEYNNAPNDYLVNGYGYRVEAVFANGYGTGSAGAATAVC